MNEEDGARHNEIRAVQRAGELARSGAYEDWQAIQEALVDEGFREATHARANAGFARGRMLEAGEEMDRSRLWLLFFVVGAFIALLLFFSLSDEIASWLQVERRWVKSATFFLLLLFTLGLARQVKKYVGSNRVDS